MISPSLPRVAILGRPNVGKSTLFNRIAGKRLAIVDDRPGVTRDWQDIPVDFWGLSFILMDTPGLHQKESALSEKIWLHTTDALLHADLYLFVIDNREGLVPEDYTLAEWARKTGKPVLLLANKCEGSKSESSLWEAYQLGLGEPLPVSAAHGEGMADLAVLLEDIFKFSEEQREEKDLDSSEPLPERPLKIGIVGRPNVGKSTLINYLLKEERMLTGPEAGLTRDAVEIPWAFEKRSLLLVDTAGLRKARKIDDALEKRAVADTLQTIQFSQVVVVVMDALQAFERQDCVIAARVVEEGRVLVLALNKWDQVADPEKTLAELQHRASLVLPQIKGVPLVPLSALQKQGIKSLMKQIFKHEKVWRTRVSTGALNRFLEKMLATHQPPFMKGRRIKLKYMTQIKSAPPTFVLFGTQTAALPGSYQNYLLNGLRETFQLQGVPLRLILKSARNPFNGKENL